MKRKIILSIQNGGYTIEFIRADGTKKSEWNYCSMKVAEPDIFCWLADDSKIPD